VDLGEEREEQHGDAERQQELLAVAQVQPQLGAGLSGERPHPSPLVNRSTTSSRRWRPARRSPSATSCSASQDVRSAMRSGSGAASTTYSPGPSSRTGGPSAADSATTSRPERLANRMASPPP